MIDLVDVRCCRKRAAPKLIGGAILVWVAACGSVAADGPPVGEQDGGGALGFVGSGGGGPFTDATIPDGDGSAGDGGLRGDEGNLLTSDDADLVEGAANSDDGSNQGTTLDAEALADGGSSVGVTFNVPGGFFPSLDWVVAGPAGHYSGTVLFGDAHSYEFVVGGIQSGDGYTLTLTGTDIYGDPCHGTSAPFPVSRGGVTAAGVVIDCVTADAQGAVVTTGSVGVDAAVVFTSH